MAVTINADTSNGLVMTPDTSGEIKLQSAGADIVSVTANGIDVTGDFTVDTTTLHVDATNNRVGIGTSSPATDLVVNTTGVQGLQLTDTSTDSSPRLLFTNDTNTWAVYNNVEDLSFRSAATIGSSSGTERMRITSSGNVLVNTTIGTPYGKVCAAGSFNADSSTWATAGAGLSSFGSYGGGLVMIDGSAGYALWVQDAGKDFYIRGNAVGSNLTGGVYINNRGTSWSAASDENVKDIIEPITNGLEKVSTLRTVIGKYKDETEGNRHPFLIAQDVQAVLPEAVSIMNKGKDTECLGLSYTDVMPLLVAAIKELKTENDTFKSQLSALETRIQALENA